jgi:subtilisin-like proprotein convertase family protein
VNLQLILILFSFFVLIPPVVSVAQVTINDVGSSDLSYMDELDGLLPVNNTMGPIGIVDTAYKFDDGFYKRIQEIITAGQLQQQGGDFGVYDDIRYYNVIIVVSGDDNNNKDSDTVIQENKDAIEKRLKAIGARDIVKAKTLSFVTASVPVMAIPGFTLNEQVYQIGDGEQKVVTAVDTARNTINASPDALTTNNIELDGTGITISIIDSGINHTSINDKVADRQFCHNIDSCRPQQSSDIKDPTDTTAYSTHGTKVAGIIAATGLDNNNGIAPGVNLLDAQVIIDANTNNNDTPEHATMSYIAHALDWSLYNGADIVNLSLEGQDCSYKHVTAYNLILNEAVDKGMIVITAAGNNDGGDHTSINIFGCAYNTITVGGINDRMSSNIMHTSSSRGPANDKILKPEIVAPANDINTIYNHHTNTQTIPQDGTSYATPQVSAASALLLQSSPHITPIEVKAALLLGANWTGPISCTSAQYERNNPSDPCSHARQPTNTASDYNSLGILNNVGFGILDIGKSLEYTSQRTYTYNHIMRDHITDAGPDKLYHFYVNDISKPIKVILTWLSHPHGSITEQTSRYDNNDSTDNHNTIANLGLAVLCPGMTIIQADSAHQTNEFAVFKPTQPGLCTITITESNLDSINKPVQNYALASTNSIYPTGTIQDIINQPPTAYPQTIIIDPKQSEPNIIRLYGTDPNNDAITFSVSQNPQHGIVSTSEFITDNSSRLFYNATNNWVDSSNTISSDTFTITPQDGITTGPTAQITLKAESLPPHKRVSPTINNIMTWDTVTVNDQYAHRDYTQTLSGPNYPISAIHTGSINMEGVDLNIITTSGDTYTMAIPPSGARMIHLDTPITISTATLSADGLDEETVDNINKYRITDTINPHAYMFVGYVPTSCNMDDMIVHSSSSCPTHNTYRISSSPQLPISDLKSTTSTIDIPLNALVSSLTIKINLQHTYIEDLEIILESPTGAQITLHNREYDEVSTDIIKTYTTQNNNNYHSQLTSLLNTNTAGNWTLLIKDHAAGDTGTLKSWSIITEYQTSPTTSTTLPPTYQNAITVFSDDFESYANEPSSSTWTESHSDNWRISTSQSHNIPLPPNHPTTNKVLHADNCNLCSIQLAEPIDLSKEYISATLSFWRFIDQSIDPYEYVYIELYDGTSWHPIYHWTSPSQYGADNTWHKESYNIPQKYFTDNFNIKISTRVSSSFEDIQLDDITITAVPHAPPIPQDDTHPTITITSTADANNHHTNKRKVTFTTTFSKPVIDFTIQDITITGTANGGSPTISNFNAINDTTYTFTTSRGTTDGTITIFIESNVTQDIAENPNTQSTPFTITIDTTPPTITPPADVSLIYAGEYVTLTSSDYGTATASDLIDHNPKITNNSPTSFPIGETTTITWIATDAAGNTASATQHVTINPPSRIIFSDTFDDGLGEWVLEEDPRYDAITMYCSPPYRHNPLYFFGAYSLSHSTENGGSAHVKYANDSCWMGYPGGARTFDIHPAFNGDALYMTFDYRSIANLFRLYALVVNAEYGIYDSEGQPLSRQAVYVVTNDRDAIPDTGWQSATVEITNMDTSVCPCEVRIYTSDRWAWGLWEKQLYFDNVVITMRPATSGTS